MGKRRKVKLGVGRGCQPCSNSGSCGKMGADGHGRVAFTLWAQFALLWTDELLDWTILMLWGWRRLEELGLYGLLSYLMIKKPWEMSQRSRADSFFEAWTSCSSYY